MAYGIQVDGLNITNSAFSVITKGVLTSATTVTLTKSNYANVTEFEVIFTPGHTKGHIAFFFPKEKVVFTGDTLFSLGCGRIFEGTKKEMYNSLNKIKNLPPDTKVYCGHEYTKSNSDFCLKYDPKNFSLKSPSSGITSIFQYFLT